MPCQVKWSGLFIPSSVTDIGFRAFVNCSGFSGELVVRTSVISIGGGAFQSCEGLDSAKFLGDRPEFFAWNGRQYYLNPVSDGTQGRMVTGWLFIDSKWCYFNEVSDGVLGAFVQDTDNIPGSI